MAMLIRRQLHLTFDTYLLKKLCCQCTNWYNIAFVCLHIIKPTTLKEAINLFLPGKNVGVFHA